MTSTSKRALVILSLAAISLSACALSGGPISGRVLDEATGKPVRDAIVVVHWHGSWTRVVLESSSACYHTETSRTDAEGRYHIAAWREPWSLDDLRFTTSGETYDVYKAGHTVARMDAATKTFHIGPYKGSPDSYFEQVLSDSSWSCSGARASRKNQYRLWKAMAEEAQALAHTPEQRSRASMLRKFAQESLVNFDKPTHYTDFRLDNVNPDDRYRIEEVPQ